jgi:hypothetical protein
MKFSENTKTIDLENFDYTLMYYTYQLMQSTLDFPNTYISSEKDNLIKLNKDKLIEIFNFNTIIEKYKKYIISMYVQYYKERNIFDSDIFTVKNIDRIFHSNSYPIYFGNNKYFYINWNKEKNIYEQKYLKYKQKYIQLKKLNKNISN